MTYVCSLQGLSISLQNAAIERLLFKKLGLLYSRLFLSLVNVSSEVQCGKKATVLLCNSRAECS